MQNKLFDCRNVDRGGLYCGRRIDLGIIEGKEVREQVSMKSLRQQKAQRAMP